MTQTEQILQNILTEISHELAQNGTVKAVFDLDSTLFDVRPRLIEIIKEFCIDSKMSELYPAAISKLSGLKNLSHSYHIKDHMYELGLQDQPEQFFKDIYAFWRSRFFHNDYVIHDHPVEGAVEFVQKLHTMGVEIIYLTGRDIPRMQEGTIKSLKKWGFPIHTGHSELVLKPHFSMDDAEFKRDHFVSMSVNSHIWFFENEPVNIHLILKDCPNVKCIFFDSVHMGEAEEPRHLPTIQHFKI